MLKNIFPYEYVETVFDIDYQKLIVQGYKVVMFDVDATLVPHGANATKEIHQLFKEIHAIGLRTFLLSNNSTDRIKDFAQGLDTEFISLANKPNRDKYLQGLKQLNISNTEAIFVGDQLFTDILGANRAGIKNILVRYLTFPNESRVSKKRLLESACLILYKFSPYKHRLAHIKRRYK